MRVQESDLIEMDLECRRRFITISSIVSICIEYDYLDQFLFGK